MNKRHDIAWSDVLDLKILKILGDIACGQWKLGIGFVNPDGSWLPGQQADPFTASSAPCALLRDRFATGCQEAGAALSRLFEERTLDRSCLVHTCPAGLQEMAAPIIAGETLLGFVVAGGYLSAGSGNGASASTDGHRPVAGPSSLPSHLAETHAKLLDQAPHLSARDEAYLGRLVQQMAHEIKEFHLKTAGVERRAAPVAPPKTRYSYDHIIGRCRPMIELYQLLDKVIGSDSTVLIQGENGTGKELIAKAIHFNSSRKDRRFVIQNCSAFNDNLLDSELFGHKKGAFTGAISDKRGLFEVADGSTFFLDEIGDMSPALQVKLLRVLQEGTFIPVGDTEAKKVDVRIIAATNRDLKKMVESGEFREDLYYRINVINIQIPPLRERKEDIPLLVEHFLQKRSAKSGLARQKRLSRGCMRRLMAFHWPGNIRELENEIERLLVLSGDEKTIGDDLLSSRIRHPSTHEEVASPEDLAGLPEAIKSLERRMIYDVLKRNHWNKTRAAQELHISRRNLIRKVNKYQLDQRRPR